ncbi:MAG TPA: hypothetical protein VJZ71_03450 [Phycisphaerae bacterium]|nr:hypothetical protein [Phycisphaerae bacterium]
MLESPPSPPNVARPPGTVLRWYVRMPLKSAAFALVTFFVLFPYPRQFARHVEHLRNMQTLVEPDAPQLDRLQTLLDERLRPIAATQPALLQSPPLVQRHVERFVLEQVHYEWDWNLWGSADYMPTVAEVFEKADEAGGELREDCDGRAIIAASLMKRLGYDATLVTDLRHVWVSTPQGEWMGPGRDKTLIATPEGTRVDWGTVVSNIPVSLSYGIGVFPFWREVIILVTAFGLSLHRRMSRRAAAIGLILLIQGLLYMRLGYLAPYAVSREVSSWPAWVGLVHVAAGFAILWRASSRARHLVTHAGALPLAVTGPESH